MLAAVEVTVSSFECDLRGCIRELECVRVRGGKTVSLKCVVNSHLCVCGSTFVCSG